MNYKTKNMAKKILASTVLTFTLFTTPLQAFAMAELYPNETIYQFVDKTNLGSGIVHENVKVSTIYGKWNINVVRIDTKNEYPELKGLINPEGLNYRDTVTNMVNKSGAVAGINGDYFNYSPVPSSLGTLINNGEVISSPITRKYALPTFYLNQENKASIDYFSRQLLVKNLSQNGREVYLNSLNKVEKNLPSLVALDKNFGHQSIGAKHYKDIVEVVVDNGLVKEVRIGWDPTPIPRNGFVLVGRGKDAEALKTFKPGDRVELIMNTTPNKEEIKFAIGGGSRILTNGKVTNSNISDSGRHPRTGIGVNKDNSEIILVTVDGRSSNSIGMTQKTFAYLMSKLGAYNALNLDGGGSTTMAVKKPNTEKAVLTNRPSDGGQRKVVNSVGVFNRAPKGSLDRIELSLANKEMFKSTSNSFKLVAFDGHNNRLDYNFENYEVKLEGLKYDLDNNVFVPLEEGRLKITASYEENGKTYEDSKEVFVFSDPVDIYTETKEINVSSGASYKLPIFKGIDKDGREAIIPNGDIDFSLSDEIGVLENNEFISNGTSGYITAEINGAVENIKILAKEDQSIVKEPISPTSFSDRLNSKNEDSLFRFVVLSETKDEDENRKAKFYNETNSSNLTASLNGFSLEYNTATPTAPKLNSNKGYAVRNLKNTKVINLDSKSGSISKTNSKQWLSLKQTLKTSLEKNIVITTQVSPLNSSDPLEARSFREILRDLKLNNPEKNIFVVHGGNSNTSSLKDGVRYIGLDSRSEKEPDVLLNSSLVEFTLDGDDLVYNYKKIYK